MAVHSDAGYLNKANTEIQVSTHIYLSETVPIPTFSRVVIKITKIITYAMSSAAEAELVLLFIAVCEYVVI